MPALLLIVASINGFLAVALGAFGAHALAANLSAERLQTFATAVDYHMYHALALLMLSALAFRFPTQALLRVSGFLFLLGIVLFSGSLYLLSLTGMSWLGAVAPLGGTSLLAAWGTLCWFAVRLASDSDSGAS